MEQTVILLRGIERILVTLGGFTLIIMGLFLFKWGLSGLANLCIETNKFKFRLLNASPGIMVTFFGAALLFSTILNPLKIDYFNNDAASAITPKYSFLYSNKEDTSINKEMYEYFKECKILSTKPSNETVPIETYKKMIESGANIFKNISK